MNKKNEFGRVIDPKGVVEPEAHMRDPATGVLTSYGRRDVGAKTALEEHVHVDLHGRKKRLPPKRVIELLSDELDGQRVDVSTVVTTLRAMYRKGSITQEMYDIGCDFKRQFDIGRLDGMRVPSLERTPSAGGSRPSDEPMRIIHAKDYVFETLEKVGGAQTSMGLALWNIVGLEIGLQDMAAKNGANRQYWSASLHNALDLLVSLNRRAKKTC